MTIAVLSWGAPKTLVNTLESYRKLGLDTLDDDRHIFFQEFSIDDEIIAHKYGYQSHGSATNIGIAGAYKELIRDANGDLFLFLENDWELIENPTQQYYYAKSLLLEDSIDVARFRHRTNPGEPLWSRKYKGMEMSAPQFLLDSVFWDAHPEHLGPIATLDGWYFTSSQFANWTNNPTMFRTSWLKEHIAPRMTGDIEKDLQPWWEQQEFRVAQGEGLFTHNRIDR